MEIKYKQLPYLLLLLSAMILVSCSKETTSTVADRPVVIGYISPGRPISVKVYSQKDITDTAVYGPVITGLKPTITDGSKSITLTESASGTYTYSATNYLTTGKTYTLQFAYNNTIVSASTVMPGKPTNYKISRDSLNIPLSVSPTAVALRFTWDNPDSLYHVLVFNNDDPNAFNIHPNRNNQLNFSFDTKRAAAYDVYYSQLNYIGVYHVMLYRVNKEYIDILSSNTNTSSQKLTNPPSNVTNGYGIFTAMQADTLRLSLTQY